MKRRYSGPVLRNERRFGVGIVGDRHVNIAFRRHPQCPSRADDERPQRDSRRSPEFDADHLQEP
jgi:hypothetical protein